MIGGAMTSTNARKDRISAPRFVPIPSAPTHAAAVLATGAATMAAHAQISTSVQRALTSVHTTVETLWGHMFAAAALVTCSTEMAGDVTMLTSVH